MGSYFGYTICNDLTARDVQKSEKQWTMGKAFDNSLPIGPYIIPSDTIPKPTNNEIWLTINGEKRQLDNTNNMIFSNTIFDILYFTKYHFRAN